MEDIRPVNPRRHSSRVIKWSLIIAIVIVLNLLFNYALSLAYPAPEFQNFCTDSQIVSPPQTQKACVAAGGQWTETTVPGTPSLSQSGYCNPEYTCQNNFDQANTSYQKNVFIVLVVLGILSIVVGIFLKASDTVSIALSLGGVLSLIIASARYWSAAGAILRVVILALALCLLIWLGIKKFRD